VEMADLESFFLTDEIFQRQTYRRALEAAGDVHSVVDLGCNVGFFSCYLRYFFNRNDFRGFGVDANAQVLTRARRNLDSNGLQGIKLLHGLVGASAENSNQDFFVYASHLGSSQFIEPEEGRTVKGTWTKTVVPVLKISEIWRSEHGEALIDLLKVDIEGSEGKLLRADPELFRRTKCLVLEWHKWLVNREELFPVLEELGFTRSEALETGKSADLWLFFRG
jgi:FkbM family methyltransferase